MKKFPDSKQHFWQDTLIQNIMFLWSTLPNLTGRQPWQLGASRWVSQVTTPIHNIPQASSQPMVNSYIHFQPELLDIAFLLRSSTHMVYSNPHSHTQPPNNPAITIFLHHWQSIATTLLYCLTYCLYILPMIPGQDLPIIAGLNHLQMIPPCSLMCHHPKIIKGKSHIMHAGFTALSDASLIVTTPSSHPSLTTPFQSTVFSTTI